MAAYYNEIDPFAAAWLRELIKAGHIADGIVDTRSIEDVRPDDLREFNQCHFFAGIGVWSYALRRAGWPDDRPIWTGSCPCQPFSSAGKGDGFADERHLWPAFFHLIRECRPPVVTGEQVASKDADPWIDLVQADLEALDYAVGACAFPSAGVGAPHIRDRLYWVGHTDQPRLEGLRGGYQGAVGWLGAPGSASAAGKSGRMADAYCRECEQQPSDGRSAGLLGAAHGAAGGVNGPGDSGASGCGMADALLQQRPNGEPGVGHDHDASGRVEGAAAAPGFCSDSRPGPVNGFWADADWLLCRDGKWRPVEPGTFPLAHGAAARVGRLRGYGNAINAVAAQAFIESLVDVIDNALDLV